MSEKKKPFPLPMIVLIVGAVFLLFYFWRILQSPMLQPPGDGGTEVSDTTDPGDTPGDPDAPTGTESPDSLAGDVAVDAPPPEEGPRRIDADTRHQLLLGLMEAMARIPPAPEGAPEGSDAPGTLDKEYLRERIAELVPLVKECYEMTLEQHPSAQGKITVEFSIIGDPELGGLVESSEVIGEPDAAMPPSLEECVRETMYGLQLKAPEGGGRVTVRYPFTFKTKGEDEGAE